MFQLLCNVGIADDRPCNELGKHRHIGCQVDQIFLSWLAPVYIHRIADDLEGVEADANGQGDAQQGNPQSCLLYTSLFGHGLLSPFEWWCRNFILPDICKPCLFVFLRNLFYLTLFPAYM